MGLQCDGNDTGQISLEDVRDRQHNEGYVEQGSCNVSRFA